MGYALFAQRKLLLEGLINNIQLQQTQRSNEQLRLSTNTANLQTEVSMLQSSQSTVLAGLYEKLASSKNETQTQAIQNQIKAQEAKNDSLIKKMEAQIQQTSIKENTINMEVKRLETRLTALQKILEKVEEAEKKGIEGAVPSFNGLA